MHIQMRYLYLISKSIDTDK